MPFHERSAVGSSLQMVDDVWQFNDDDDSASVAPVRAKAAFPDATIVFGKGGDR